MSIYVLDTDTLTLYQKGHPVVVRHAQAKPITDLAASVISVEEQLSGWYTRLRKAKKRDELALAYQSLTDAVRFLVRFQLISFTEPAIIRYEQLRASHRNIGKNDLRIAAIVLEQKAKLVTRNKSDFDQIPGLVVEDWTV